MKHILLVIIACIMAGVAHGQWSRFAAQPKVYKLPYKVDSFSYRGETVPVQRFKEADLNTVLGDNAEENRVALAITKLQESLNNMRAGLLAHRKIGIIDEGRGYLDDIKRQNTKFDPSLLESEYQLYYKYRNADIFDSKFEGAGYSSTTTRTKEQEQQAFAAEKERVEREETKRIHDSTITSLNEELKRKMDTIAAVMEQNRQAALEQEEARRDAALKKKYGETAFNKAVAGKIWIGMTDELCERAVGAVNDIKRTTTKDGVTEEWFAYDIGNNSFWARKIIFRNHVITAIIEHE